MVLEATRVFPWDHFLDEAVRIQVEGFRRSEWPNIRNALSKAPYNYVLPKGLEPCWVSPGKAIFWQKQTIRRPVAKTDSDGREYREMEDFVEEEWAQTNPFPANNASMLSYHLQKKGFRLRPPGQEVVEAESAVPSEEPTQATVEYRCYRHGAGRRAFKTWKAYLQHCWRYKEAPEHELPPEVVDKQQNFLFYCGYHDKGFNNESGAKRHMTVEIRKPGKGYHPSIEDMRVNKGGTTNGIPVK